MFTARKLGMLTYRSAREWDIRFGRARIAPEEREEQEDRADRAGRAGRAGRADLEPFGREFQVEEYLERHARRFAHRFDPNSYLCLSRCMDRFDLGESCGTTTDEALSRVPLERALVIGVETDILFPLHQQQQIADGLCAGGTAVEFVAMDSPEGHDAFLIDTVRFGAPVAKFLTLL
ncbi:hypothetical protein [Streptomyces cirratus]